MHVSALIADDDAFCDYIDRVWGCGNRQDHDDREPSIGNNGNLRENSYTSERSSSSIREPDGTNKGAGKKSSNDNGNSDGQNVRERGSAAGEKISPRTAVSMAGEDCPLPPPPPTNAERGSILQRGIAKDGKASRLAVPSGVLGLLGRARGNLATRGMRAAFQLLKSFREEDRRGKGMVTLSGFKKAVGEAALGLKEPEMRIIFEVRAVTHPSQDCLLTAVLGMTIKVPELLTGGFLIHIKTDYLYAPRGRAVTSHECERNSHRSHASDTH